MRRHITKDHAALTFKALLVQWERLAISAGLMVGVPTASDTNVVLADGTHAALIEQPDTIALRIDRFLRERAVFA